MSFSEIKRHQDRDQLVQKGLNEKSFIFANYGKLKLAVLVQNNRKRVFIPESLQANLMDWFHENLSHPGQKRMYNTMSLYYTWKGMKEDINKFVVTCEKCQKNKKTTIKNMENYQSGMMLLLILSIRYKST